MSQCLLNCIIEWIEHDFVRLKTCFDDVYDIIDESNHLCDVFSFQKVFTHIIHNLLEP
jgi:hypothetical protein